MEIAYADSQDDADATGLKTEERKPSVTQKEARRLLRSILRTILSRKRPLRFLLELVGDLIPGVDALTGAATIADLVNLARDLAAEIKGAKEAIAFAQKGPHAFGRLLVDSKHVSFPNYSAFKKLEDFEKVYGQAGPGFHYHHIVEQSAEGGKHARDDQLDQQYRSYPGIDARTDQCALCERTAIHEKRDPSPVREEAAFRAATSNWFVGAKTSRHHQVIGHSSRCRRA